MLCSICSRPYQAEVVILPRLGDKQTFYLCDACWDELHDFLVGSCRPALHREYDTP